MKSKRRQFSRAGAPVEPPGIPAGASGSPWRSRYASGMAHERSRFLSPGFSPSGVFHAGVHRSRARLRRPALAAGAAALLLSAVATAQPRRGAHDEVHRDPWSGPALPELLEHSETVVAGEVLDMRSEWTADRRSIFTTVTLRADRRFKGSGQNPVRFRIPGGTVGDTRLFVTHHPRFRVGERALVFLSGKSGRLPEVVGGTAGKRHLRAAEDGADRILPGFLLSAPAPGASREIGTLDELAAALPRLRTPEPR